LVHAYNRHFILGEEEVRKLARSGMWRVLYNSVGSSTEVFDRPVCDFDINQMNLIYWTTIYNNVMECSEPPSNDIINNDMEFDNWSKAYSDKIKKDNAKNNISTGGKKTGNLTETFLITDEAGADKLYKDVGVPEIKFKK
jgi:hypothetical protein